MDFELTEEQEIFRESFRKFLEAEIQPLDDRFGDEEMTAERARELSKKLIPWGFLGGEGAAEVERDTTIRCIQTEELSRVFPGLSGITGMTAACAAGIAAGAHPEVAARLVEPLRQGELIGSNAISEPNVGSDASAIECRAEKKGDRWIVNGTKCWISNGHIADVSVALLQTDPAQGPAGLRHFVIDRRESPFESRETPTIGLKSFPTSELYFRDLEVPDVNRIGSWKESAGSEASGQAFRRFLARHRPARLRHRVRLRAAAQAVRQGDRALPADLGDDRRDGDRDRRGPPALPPGVPRIAQGPLRRRGLDGQVVRHGDGGPRHVDGHPVHGLERPGEREPGRTLPARCAYADDARRHHPDSKAHHRPRPDWDVGHSLRS
jgi:alkylation response protein AidB-like acyl-CoA dehydrogenase